MDRDRGRRPSCARHAARDRSSERDSLSEPSERAQTRPDQTQNQEASEGRRVGVKAIFLGTPEFAVPTLERMIAAGYRVLEVVTQPDLSLIHISEPTRQA